MTWTYSGDPKASELDLYRFLISDTVEYDPIMQDEEITYILGEYSDQDVRLYHLFTKACDVFSREYKRSLGPQSEDPTSRLSYYKMKADEYKAKLVTGGFANICGKPIFRIGMHDHV